MNPCNIKYKILVSIEFEFEASSMMMKTSVFLFFFSNLARTNSTGCWREGGSTLEREVPKILFVNPSFSNGAFDRYRMDFSVPSCNHILL